MNKEHSKLLLPIGGLSLVAFLESLVSTILYGANCGSEFNGGKPSEIVIGWGIAAIIVSCIAVLGYAAGLFLIKGKKSAHLFYLARFGNYAAFATLIGSFFYQILEEYSLLGTILYPIVSGTVGDPVDPTLVACYFTSLILSLDAMIISLVVGIIVRKKSHKFLAESEAK